MRCLSLTAPYGTLIAIAEKHPELGKKIETRSWATKYRGPLAIHQAQGLGPVGGKRGLYDLCYSSPFLPVLEPAMTGERDIAGFKIPHTDPGYLPRGAIVAVCDLVACEEMDPEDICPNGGWWKIIGGKRMHWALTSQERLFGLYTSGRYAWLLANIRALPEPVPCKGALSLWEPDTLTQLAVTRQLIKGIGQ